MNELTRMLALRQAVNDPTAKICETMERLINDCLDYVQRVVDVKVLKVKAAYVGGADFETALQLAFVKRHRSFSKMVADIRAINGACEKYGVSKVFAGTGKREEYRQFAIDLINTLYIS